MLLVARCHHMQKSSWRISSSDEKANVFLGSEFLPSTFADARVDICIFFDATVAGSGMADTNEKRSTHLVLWNQGTVYPRVLCPNDTPESLDFMLPPNMKTIVSGHGDGVVIEIGWVRLRLMMGADDATHLSRPWMVDREYFIHQGADLTPEFTDHAVIPTCVQGVKGGVQVVSRCNILGLIASDPRFDRRTEVLVFKHLKMRRVDITPYCTAHKLLHLKAHVSSDISNSPIRTEIQLLTRGTQENIVQYEDWCPVSRLLARKYFPDGAITYTNFNCYDDVMLLAYDMIMALRFLHSNRIIHANIKRTNMFLVHSPGRVFKLADFALTAEDDSIPLRIAENYIAPEVVRANGRGMAIDRVYMPKSDVWALGIVLLEILVKEPPRNWYSPKRCYEDAVERKKDLVESCELSELLDAMLQPVLSKRKTSHQLALCMSERP